VPDYNRFWVTTSVRGVLEMDLHVQTLQQGIHSGVGSGIVADTFRITRSLLKRIEQYDASKGTVRIPSLEVAISKDLKKQVQKTADVLGDISKNFPLQDGVSLISSNPLELLLNNSWRPTLTVVGGDGLPHIKVAGNVLRPYTNLKLSFRLPPTVPFKEANDIIFEKLCYKPPYNSEVDITHFDGADGMLCPVFSDKTKQLFTKISKQYFSDNDYCEIGVGGSIGFMKIFQNSFKDSLFLLTGCCGQDSNAHGPNESLNLDYTKQFICALAHFITEFRL
jgi:acetylornithine deacetylase/succinyl-diaminopimelate desuccinylase-like protein